MYIPKYCNPELQDNVYRFVIEVPVTSNYKLGDSLDYMIIASGANRYPVASSKDVNELVPLLLYLRDTCELLEGSVTLGECLAKVRAYEKAR